MADYVLVTGASGNLGRAIVDACIASGNRVIAHTRTADSKLVPSHATHHVHADLTNDAEVQEMCATIHSVLADGDELTGVVANAAEQQTGPLSELSTSEWLRMHDATFMSAVRTVHGVLPFLAEGGAIVTISSIEAQAAFVNHAHYAAAKAALEAYTRALAVETAPRGVRANAVAPGLIAREGLERAWPEGHSWWTRTAPIGRPVTPGEVADAVVFLLRASGISGQILAVDGGWSASARQ